MSGETFQFNVNYNTLADYFTLDLYKDHEVIVLGEKIVFNNILFERYNYKEIPKDILFVNTQTLAENRVTFENLGEDVFIFAINEVDLNVD